MRARTLHTAALGAAIAILAVVAPALAVARASAAPAPACTTTAGVTVIVDFSHFGRAIERGCAPGQPASALAALRAAGFETAGTTRYGDAFVCRIDNLPAPKREACADTPPATSSWSFYNARANDPTWTYTSIGVLSYRPPSGSIIAFAFGNLAKPGIRPAAAIPGTSTATTNTDPTPPTAPAATVPAAPTPTAVAPPTTTAVSTTRPAVSRAPTTVRPTKPAPGTSTSTRIVDHTGTIPQNSSGSPFPAVLTAAIVVLLAVGAAVTVSTRRRRSA